MISLNTKHIPEVLKIVESHETEYKDFKRFGLAWSKAQVMDAVTKDAGFGILDSDRLVAFILGRKIDEETFEVDMTMTSRNDLQKGHMIRLFQEMAVELKSKRGFSKIWLEVHEENLPAVSFYKKLGFQENSRRPKYYSDGKAAILMTLSL